MKNIMRSFELWKLGEGKLARKLMNNGLSGEQIKEVLDKTRSLRAFSYNRGVFVFYGCMLVWTGGAWAVYKIKQKMRDKKWKKHFEEVLKEMKEMKEHETENEEVDAE